jgi:hypothetical protein
MRVISAATVTARGEPRISAMDGHFLHGTWTFSTSRTAAKARQLAARPAISIAHVDGEELAVFSHGRAVELAGDELQQVVVHWTGHYGSWPLSWGDVVMYRLDPSWMVGYAFRRAQLLADRGIPARGTLRRSSPWCRARRRRWPAPHRTRSGRRGRPS